MHETIVEKITARWAVTADGVMFSSHADEADAVRHALATGLTAAQSGASRVLVRYPDGRMRVIWDSAAQNGSEGGTPGVSLGGPHRSAPPDDTAREA